MNRRSFIELVCASAAATQFRYAHALESGLALPTSSFDDLPAAATPVPVPITVVGVKQPVISLNGTWRFLPEPPADLSGLHLDGAGWRDVEMPNEFTALGFSVSKDVAYPCGKTISIPADFAGKTILLRFDGVYSHARIRVNGHLLREHFGGFTSWDCDITSHVTPGSTADLMVEITDRHDDISQESYYAKHSIAGILRDVRLIALPQVHVRHLHVAALLDKDYKNGILTIGALFSEASSAPVELRLRVSDHAGKPVALTTQRLLSQGPGTLSKSDVTVLAPKRWDSDHPYLYQLEIDVVQGGAVLETLKRQVGFRTVERKENQLLVNGQPVKLRGVCRHSIHPITGRVVAPSLDEKDAELLRKANINFVRTSHYPPSEYFLDACDRVGIYVEEETAVCWSEEEDGSSSDAEFTSRFMSQFQEMICRDHSHASVLFWSLGNESKWGSNFTAELKFARRHDPTRPLIFSYPNSGSLEQEQYDIYSKHYADVDSDLGSSNYPVLHDEFAHVSCYNPSTLVYEPGVRNFWGESIKRFGDKFIATDGCLGGSIWGGIDEVFLLRDGATGYGPWGVIDGWRREKPEYWLTKKAYSPIRIEDRPMSNPGAGNELLVPITNAFDHTNLSEVTINWSVGKESGQLHGLDIAPHASGYFRIPARKWKSGDEIEIKFDHPSGNEVDRFLIPIEHYSRPTFQSAHHDISLTETSSAYTISGGSFSIPIDRTTGLIKNATYNSKVLIESGPYLDIGHGRSNYWRMKRCDVAMENNVATVRVAGEMKTDEGFRTVRVEYELVIAGDGSIKTRYRTDKAPAAINQLGMGYVLPSSVDRIKWHRKGLWSTYPDDHIGRTSGVAFRTAKHVAESYRTEPTWSWSEDMHDFFLQGHTRSSRAATNDFKSMKEHVWYAACVIGESGLRVRTESEASVAAKASVEADGRVLFTTFNYWRFPDLAWGNYYGVSGLPAIQEYEFQLRMSDTDERDS